MLAGTRLGTRFEARRTVDPPTRAAAIALHSVWLRTLATVTAGDTMHDLEDFLRLLERRTVIKALAFEGDDLVGVTFLTNELESVPRISAEFFRARFPAEVNEGEVWYLIAGVAHPLRPGVLGGLAQVCVNEARARNAAVLVWDASTLRQEASQRTTLDAVTEAFGEPADAEELDRVSYLAVRLPRDGAVIDLRP